MSGIISKNYHTNGIYTILVEWSAVHNVASNKSTISASLKIRSNTSGATLYVSPKANSYITIDGVQKKFTSADVSHGGAKTTTLGTASVTVNHDSAGNKTLTITGYWPCIATLTGIYYANMSCSGSVSLNKITQSPNTPTSLSTIKVSDSQINLSWSHSATNLRPLTRFRIQRKVDGGSYSDVTTRTTKTYSDAVSPNHSYQYRVRAENSAGNSSYVVGTAIKTSPAAITNLLVQRVKDSQQNLSWKNASWPSGVCEKLRIQRWDNITNSYVDLKTLATPIPSSYSDVTTKADYKYRYRIRAENSGGSSSYLESSYIYTTPKAPTSVKAVRDGMNVIITCTNGSAIVETTALQYQLNNGAWQALKSFVGNENYYQHSDPPGGELRYRWRNERGDLYSAWAESGTVITEVPPAAPINLSPNGIVFDALDGFSFLWSHVPIDGSSQTKAELRWREKGTTAWIGNYAHNLSSQSVILDNTYFDNGKEYEWGIRTKGSHNDFGPWSNSASFKTSERPFAVILYPPTNESIHDNPEITIVWDYHDAEETSQFRYILTLYSSTGKILGTFTEIGDASEKLLNYVLKDQNEYSIGLKVMDGDGMWSEEIFRTFFVEYSTPEPPVLDFQTDEETGSVAITITNPYNPENPNPPEVIYNRIFRKVDDFPEMLIADHIPPDGTIADFFPGICNTNVYRVEAVSEIDSVATNEFVLDLQIIDYIFINSGVDSSFNNCIPLTLSLTMNHSFRRSSVQHHFHGRKYPVHYEGEQAEWQTEISSVIDYDMVDRIEKFIQNSPGPYFYRDPTGKWFPISIINSRISMNPPTLPVFSLTAMRLDIEGLMY